MNYKIPEGAKEISVTETEGKIVVEFIAPPRFKEGDVVCKNGRIIIVKTYPSFYYVLFHPETGGLHLFGNYGVDFIDPDFRLATEKEKQKLFDALKKEGKKWNAEKMCVEEITERERIEEFVKNGYWDNREWSYIQLSQLIEDYLKIRESK